MTTARVASAKAKVELEVATRDLSNFDRARLQNLADARQATAKAEVAVADAEEAQASFTLDYDKELGTARQIEADAAVTITTAKDAVADLVIEIAYPGPSTQKHRKILRAYGPPRHW